MNGHSLCMRSVLAIYVLLCARIALAQPAVEPGEPLGKPEKVESKQPQDILYRKVQVRDADLDDVLNGYIPLERDRFNQLLSDIYDSADEDGGMSMTRITSARYRAILRQDVLASGVATWSIRHNGEEPSLLSVKPLAISLSQPQWIGDEESDATLGWKANGTWKLLVSESGELRSGWSTRGKYNRLGDVRFDLALPNAETTTLIIDMAETLVPVLTSGVVSEWQPSEDVQPDGESVDLPIEEGMRRWVIELGATSRSTLLVRSATAQKSSQKVSFITENLRYTISDVGINLDALLTVDVNGDPLDRLELLLGDGLFVRTATLDQQRLAVDTHGDEQRSVDLIFPELLSGPGNEIRVSAIAPLLANQQFQLPGLTAANVVWRQGQQHVSISDHIQINTLDVLDAVPITPIEPWTESSLVRSYQMNQPSARVLMQLTRKETDLRVLQHSVVRVESDDMYADCRLDLSTSHGKIYDFQVTLQSGWIVDSVEMISGADVESFTVLNGVLSIELDDPITSELPTELAVRCRRAVVNSRFNGSDLRILEPVDASDTLATGSLSVDPSIRLSMLNDSGLQRVPTADEDVSPVVLSYRVNHGLDITEFRIQDLDSHYAIQSITDVLFESFVVRERFSISVLPESNPVERVEFQLSGTTATDIQWQLADAASTNQISAQLIPGVVGGGRWEVVFREPVTEPTIIIGSVETRTDGPYTVPLIRVPDASDDSGRVIISAQQGVRLELDSVGVISEYPEIVSQQEYSQEKAFFRYQSNQPGSIRVNRLDASARRMHWAWSQAILLTVNPHGEVQHDETFNIENNGDQFFSVQLTENAELQSVMVNGISIQVPPGHPASENRMVFDLPLPPLERFVTLQLRYRTDHSELSRITPLRVPVAVASCLVMRSNWTVAVPPGFESAGGIAANSLSGRLFGPWIRRTENPPFNLFNGEDWQGVFGDLKGRTATPAFAGGIAAELEAALRDEGANDNPVTWADWFARYNRYVSRSGNGHLPFCLIDIVGLEHAGITASARIVSARAIDNTNATEILKQHDLILLLVDSKLVLTHKDSVLELDSDGVSSWILETERSYPVEFLLGSQYLLPTDWSDSHGRFDARAIESSDATGEIAQWQYVSGSLTSDGHVNVRLYHETTNLAVCWAVFLISLGGMVWLGVRHQDRLLYVIAALAALCIVAPNLMFPVLSYVFMASLLSVFWIHSIGVTTRSRGALEQSEDATDGEFTLQWVPKVMHGLLWMATLSATASVLAQEATMPELPTVFDVYYPVDADNNPAGKYVYLPEAFYRTIHQRTAAQQTAQSDWMITKTEYEVDWNWDANLRQFFDQQLKLNFTIVSAESTEQIQLPIRADQVRIEEVRINDEVVLLQWNARGTAIILEAIEASVFDVAITATPTITSLGQLMGLKCEVPAVPDSVLRINHPQDSPEIEVASALGMISRDEATGESVVQLGTAGVLDLSWATGFESSNTAAVVTVDEYYWLDVDPHSVTVDARYEVEVVRGQVRYLEFLLDHDVRTIPIQEAGLIEDMEIIRDADSSRLYVTLSTPQSGRFNLDLKFYLHEQTGTGTVRKPGITPVVSRIGSRWLGVTISNRLQWLLELSESETRVTPKTFADTWGGETLPTLAFTSSTADSPWQLNTSYQVPQTHVTQLTTMLVQKEAISVEYEATVNTFRGGSLQYQLKTPPEFSVESLSVIQDGAPMSVEYVDNSQSAVHVFLDRPVVGEHKIVMRGRVPSGLEPQRIPNIQIEDTSLLSDRVLLQRRATVTASVSNLSEGSVYRGGTQQGSAGFGAYVMAEITNDTGDPITGSLSIASNQLAFRSAQVTELIRDDTNWLSKTSFSVDVVDGVLDVIRLRVPDDWDTQLEIQPPMQTRLQSSLEQGRVDLLLIPTKPVTSDSSFEFSIQRRLVVPEGGVRVPRLEMLDAQQNGMQSYVALPRNLEDRRIQWQVSQLQPIQQWTSPLMDSAISNQSHEVFLASPVAWDAHIFNVEDAESDPNIRISNHSILLDPNSGIQGSAWFVVEPANHTEVGLSLPQGTNLVSVLVGNISVEPEKISATEYKIDLLTPYSPQLVRVIFHRTLQIDNRGISTMVLDLPRIANVSVTTSLLSIAVTGDSRLLSVEGADSRTVEDYHLSQLESLNDVLETTIDVATGHSSVSLQREVQNWMQQFAAIKDGMAHLVLDDESRGRFQEVGARHDQLKTSVISGEVSDIADSLVYQDWVWTNHVSGTLQTAVLEAPQVTVKIEFAHSSEQSIWMTLFMLSMVATTVFAIQAVSSHVLTIEWLQYSPRMLMALAGICWWIWLSPSLFGLFIIGISLFSQFVSTRRLDMQSQVS